MSQKVKIIYKKKHVEGDHEEHVDERWLVSYSDMMTLLFGLFVMLYAMQDPEATKQMQESIKQKFTQESTEPTPEPAASPDELKKQLDILTAQLEEQKIKANEAEALKTNLSALEDERNRLKLELEKQLAENTKSESELKKLQTEKQESARSIASIEEEKKSLIDVNEENKKLKDELAKKVAELEKLDKPTPEKKDFEKEYQAEMEKVKTLDKKNKDLEAKINAIEQKGSFLAVVFNWTTNEHDLDLVVKDPNGKKFTFKNKEFPNYPGKMVLDSRRGPGAEIWQADKVIAGTYEAEITFYNQYGNTVPAEGKLSIFSSRSSLGISDIVLDLSKNPKRKVLFEVSSLGEITLK